jgi:hypothetical protein
VAAAGGNTRAGRDFARWREARDGLSKQLNASKTAAAAIFDSKLDRNCRFPFDMHARNGG